VATRLSSRVDGHLAGFVILDEKSRITGDSEVMDVAEFFVMRKYRRKGVGLTAAMIAFDFFPRRWEVRQMAKNVSATAFWRKAIAQYTSGRFEEIVFDDDRWRGPVQSFDARRRS
jgi:predicted acetyltransferase